MVRDAWNPILSLSATAMGDVEIMLPVDRGEMTAESSVATGSDALAGLAPDVGPDESALYKHMAGCAGAMHTLDVWTATGGGGGKVRVSIRVAGSKPSEGAAHPGHLREHPQQMHWTWQSA